GNSIFTRLYAHNGTLYFVTSHPERVPDARYITSSGGPLSVAGSDPPRPSQADFAVISPEQARRRFGRVPVVLSGTSFLITENAQFAAHYYHFGAEILLSLWRTYMSLDPLSPPSGRTSLAPPARIVYPHVPSFSWRDRAHFLPFLLHAAFPTPPALLFAEDWADLAALAPGYTWVFDRAVLFDRWAAENGPHAGRERKCSAEAFSLGWAGHFWEPVRRSVLRFARRGALDSGTPSPRPRPSPGPGPGRPVVTYISRQGTKRRLVEEDHDALVAALEAGQESLGYDLRVVRMEDLAKAEQVALAAQTTIMLGVHGNGLTHLLWMARSPRSALLEVHYPGAFRVDYEVAAKQLGHQYRGFWNDTYVLSSVL
ncbi:hypothetical protein CALCODRAFT_421035, partial [Calocera cornea HHB12733]